MSNYTPEQLASLAKERPKNESEKRFILSKEDFSKERLAAVKEEIKEMQEKNPEVLSLCMFGSMVKGTAHEGSDIDGYLFVDSELAAQKENIPESDILQRHPTRNETHFTYDHAKKYSLEFRNGLKEKVHLEDKDVEHIRSLPVSEKVIDDEIQTLLEYYKKTDSYHSEYDAWLENKPQRGSELTELLAYNKAKPERPVFTSPGLTPMFLLDVGGGIRKYRKVFIEKLSELGKDGERIWEDTIKGTESLENNFSADNKKNYPRTLDKAKEVYN